MFTITTIRPGTCDDCHTIGNGVEFVLRQDSGAKAFLCWKHFRMTLEAMRAASVLPVDAHGASQEMVDEDAIALQRAPRHSVLARPTSTTGNHSHNADHNRQNLLHGETKGGTDNRDTGGES
jgi:hypothetical protein